MKETKENTVQIKHEPKEITVRLQTVLDVKRFVDACSKYKGEATIYSGRYVIDAKSIVNVYTLDLSKPLKVEFDGEISDDIRKELAPLVVA